jgi:hypothetical protein
MIDFSDAIAQNFAAVAVGKRRTFAIRDHSRERVVMRELLALCKSELFIFDRTLSPDLYPTAILRNLSARRPAIDIRILLERPSESSGRTGLAEIIDLLESDRIQLRVLDAAAQFTMTVVDRRHLRIAQRTDQTLIDLNSSSDATNALTRLETIWNSGKRLSLRNDAALKTASRITAHAL